MGGYICVTLREQNMLYFLPTRTARTLKYFVERTIWGTADIFSASKENVLGNTVSDLSENPAEKSFCSRQILIELGRNKQVCQIFFRKK